MDVYFSNPVQKKYVPVKTNGGRIYENVETGQDRYDDEGYGTIIIVKPEKQKRKDDNYSIAKEIKAQPKTIKATEYKHSKTFIELFPSLLYEKTFSEKLCCKRMRVLQIISKIKNNDINLEEKNKVMKTLNGFNIRFDEASLRSFCVVDLYLLATLLENEDILVSVIRDHTIVSVIPKVTDSSIKVFQEYFRIHQMDENITFFFTKTRDYIIQHFTEAGFSFNQETFKEFLR